MSSLLEMAEEEERRLLNELRQQPLFQKLEAVRTIIEKYKTPTYPDTSVFRAASAVSSRRQGKGHVWIERAAVFLRQHRSRAPARAILQAIDPEAFGMGINAVNAFASALSHSPLFDNIRGEGYGLVEWHRGESPDFPGTELQPKEEAKYELPR